MREDQPVWVELSVPSLRSTGPRRRIVKVQGAVRRVESMGDWRSIIVVVFETDFPKELLDPML